MTRTGTGRMVAVLWGAHAPSRAGDDALVIANFFTGSFPGKISLTEQVHGGDGAAISTRGACAPRS